MADANGEKKKTTRKNLGLGTISLLTQYLKQPLLSSFFIHSHVAVKGRLSLFSFHRASIFHGINANVLPTMNNEDRKEQNESNQIDATEPAPTSPRRWHPSCLSIVVIQRRRCRSAGVSQWRCKHFGVMSIPLGIRPRKKNLCGFLRSCVLPVPKKQTLKIYTKAPTQCILSLYLYYNKDVTFSYYCTWYLLLFCGQNTIFVVAI